MKITNILGVNVSCFSFAEILSTISQWIDNQERRTIFYANAHVINTACEQPEFLSFIDQADLIYADGIGVVWASRFLGGCELTKYTGADWIYQYCQFAEARGLSTYLLGGAPGIAELAETSLLNSYSKLKIVGSSDGYFKNKNENQVLVELARLQPDVLLVGMGTPNQEEWICLHRAAITAPVCWAVGALFDYLAGVERRVPNWMNAIGLEWLWRLLVDPAGKWRRYLFGNPKFIFRILRAKLKKAR